MWDYIYFIVHLNEKDSSDYTGVETIVKGKYDEREIDWVPRLKSLSLNQRDDEEIEGNGGIDIRLSNINRRLGNCVTALEEVQVKIARRDRMKAEQKKLEEIEKNKSANNSTVGGVFGGLV